MQRFDKYFLKVTLLTLKKNYMCKLLLKMYIMYGSFEFK